MLQFRHLQSCSVVGIREIGVSVFHLHFDAPCRSARHICLLIICGFHRGDQRHNVICAGGKAGGNGHLEGVSVIIPGLNAGDILKHRHLKHIARLVGEAQRQARSGIAIASPHHIKIFPTQRSGGAQRHLVVVGDEFVDGRSNVHSTASVGHNVVDKALAQIVATFA